MRRDTISRTQLMALIWAGSLAPAAEQLPTLLLPAAGQGAWLAVLAAAPPVLLAGWLLDKVSGGAGLARGITGRLGPAGGGGLLLFYMVWGEVLLALRLRLSAQRLLASGWRDGSLDFFLLGLAGMALWMGLGRLPSFARAGQLFLTALLAAAAVVLGLALPQVRAVRMVPFWSTPAPLGAALPAAGVLGWGLFGGFLLGNVKDKEGEKGWHWLFWGLGGCALLALAQAVILGNLGAALAARLDSPFFALAKSVGIEGAFQRAESAAAALWTLADLTQAGVLLFALRTIAGELSAKCEKAAVWIGVPLAAALGLMPLPLWGEARGWSGDAAPWINLFLGGVVPGVLACLPVRRATSCGEKGE